MCVSQEEVLGLMESSFLADAEKLQAITTGVFMLMRSRVASLTPLHAPDHPPSLVEKPLKPTCHGITHMNRRERTASHGPTKP